MIMRSGGREEGELHVHLLKMDEDIISTLSKIASSQCSTHAVFGNNGLIP